MEIENNNQGDEIAVRISDVSKSFKLPHERHSGLKQAVTSLFQRRAHRGYEIQHALTGVSFEVKKGEFFGIVGRNGSGKSTLLKVLSGIYLPDRGSVEVSGNLVPFIELGVGFNPELTGRENVFLNGALLGFTRKQVAAMYDEIVSFAELEKFMDQKLKNYSSGMQVRLAFSVAIRAESDILVLDEVLAVGDEAFQRKCYQYFAEIKRKKKTVILVTHSMDAVQQFCDRAALIDKEHKTEVGTPLKIAQIYRELNEQDGVTVNRAKGTPDSITKYINANMYLTKHDNKLDFDIKLTPQVDLENPVIAIEIYRDNGEQVYRWLLDKRLGGTENIEAKKDIHLNLQIQNIFPLGSYSIRLLVKKGDRTKSYGVFNDIIKFEIKNRSSDIYDVFWKPKEEFSLRVGDE